MNSALYCEVLWKLQDAIRRKCPAQLGRGVLLLHDNARPHKARTTQERIQELQWELLELPPHSPVLALSDFYMFGPLRNNLGGRCFTDDEEVGMEVWKWLRQQSNEFYAVDFDALVKCWKNLSVKNAVFWDVVLCKSCVNQRFGGTYRLHLQGRKIRSRETSVSR
jgi:hypothetical protein